MNTNSLLLELQHHDISISLDKEDLLINFEGDDVSEILIEKIRNNKPALVAYLKKYAGQNDFQRIQPVEIQECYPISVSQRRIWILSQFPEISKAYMIPNEIPLTGDFKFDIFRKAIDAVIERHEILRTVFREDSRGEIRQWIIPSGKLDFKISFLDFSDRDDAVQTVDQRIEQDGLKAFDLTQGPMIRAMLFKVSSSDYRFYYIMHHIISDGWSLGVLANNVLNYYNSFCQNLTPDLSPLDIQYKDYASWQTRQLAENNFAEEKKYWMQIFSERVNGLELPNIGMRPKVKTHHGEVIEFYLSKQVTSDLKDLSRQCEGSLFITLLTLWNILFYRYTNQRDIVVGTAVAGRNHAGLEEQIGFYVNTLPLKNTIAPEQNFTTLYASVKSSLVLPILWTTFWSFLVKNN